MPNAQTRIVEEVSRWPGVVASPHRFGGVEFKLGRRDFGHIHGDHLVDIPFPMEVRNRLIAEGKAEPHHHLPKSGWVTFQIRRSEDTESAVALFRLCYELAAANKTVNAPEVMRV
jgi:hypothetical protein